MELDMQWRFSENFWKQQAGELVFALTCGGKMSPLPGEVAGLPTVS